MACNEQGANKSSQIVSVNDESAISSTYAQYTKAIASSNGLLAADFLSQNSLTFYNGVLDLVLNADSAKLMLTGPLVCFTTLAIRHTVDWNQLRAMTGKDLFAYAIANGMIGKDSDKTTLGTIKLLNDSVAQAIILLNHQPTNQVQGLLREYGQWRIDLIPQLNQNDMSLQKALQNFNGNNSQKISAYFNAVFGTALNRTLWLPVQKFNK